MGTTPDGWWHDRRGAVRRLLARLQCFQRHTGTHMVLVLDVRQPDLPEGEHDGVTVRYARRKGRDAADDRIVELLDEAQATGLEVVTSDRALAAQAAARGAAVTGAKAFLGRVAAAGC